jgi:hypothetical protein
LASDSPSTFPFSTSIEIPISLAVAASAFGSRGRNSWSGGSRSRIVTGRSPISRKMPTKSPRCMGRILASAFFRPSGVSARIISRTAVIRASSKNMCSVRQRPMPSAPNARATWASRGVPALARTPSRRTSSAHARIRANCR